MSRWENKYVIGLTGNIAVGKSVVRQMLQHLGAYTIDADGLSHQAMAPGAPAYRPIVETFGRFILDGEGRINRTRLGAIAFSVPEALTALEAIIHPAVRQAVGVLVTRAKQQVVVIEAIKLLEGDLANAVDAIWVVDASPETQLRRLLEKRKMSVEDARKRITTQGAQAEKLKLANVIIMNDGNVEETWRQVQMAWDDVQRAIAPAPAAAPVVKPISSAPSASPASAPANTPTAASAAPASAPAAPPKPSTASPEAPATGQRAAAAPSIRSLPSTGRLNQPGASHPAVDGGVSPAAKAASQVIIRRGMPGNAETIASFITRVSSKPISRMDIMLAFGQKSFLLAYGKNETLIGVVGWQVENLITRVDEFYIAPETPKADVLGELITAVEDASKELQSEVSFIVLPRVLGGEIGRSFIQRGYRPLKLEEIRFPAWREAAQEMLTVPEADVLIKQLRADRVMKPI